MNQVFKNILFLLFANLIFAVGVNLFFLPHDLVTGGISGLGIVVESVFSMPVSLFTFLGNAFLLIFAFLFISKNFAYKSIIGGVILLPIFLEIVPVVMVSDDILLSALFGGVCTGLSLTCLVLSESSTGGTTITGKLLAKYTPLNFAQGCGISDLIVVIVGGLTFGLEPLLYSLVAIATATGISSYLETGFNKKFLIHIISDEFEQINQYINTELPRGTTILEGFGGYSKFDKKIIFCVVDKNELRVLRKKVYEYDDSAFLVVNHASATYGKGFLSFD